MTVREYLESIFEAGERIELKRQQVQRLHESMTSLSAPMDKEHVFHTKNVDVMADTIARIIDIEHEIDQQTERLYRMRHKASIYLDMLKPSGTRVLTMRYIEGMDVEKIAAELHYAKSSVFRLIRNAIAELQSKVDELGDITFENDDSG